MAARAASGGEARGGRFMYQAPSAPLSMGGVLDSGFTLFRECFTQVFLFAFATSLITAPRAILHP